MREASIKGETKSPRIAGRKGGVNLVLDDVVELLI